MRYFIMEICCLLFTACGSSENLKKQPAPEVDDSQIAYNNPVIRISAPDPAVIRAKDGFYYLYATENIRNLPIFKSENMIDWEDTGTAFTEKTRPDFIGKTNNTHAAIWAPEIQYIKNKYVLFYSLAQWGNHWISTIGYAISDSPAGPFTVQGKVFDSHDVNVENSIDQFFYEEDGKYYMLWGSFFGIYIVELYITDDWQITPKLETKRQIAGTAYEGINLWKRNGYYYLFASTGTCCEGRNSTYTTVVARSENLFGSYIDRNGRKMLDNAHEVIIKGNDHFVGTGHNSILQEDDEGNTWIFYHAYQLDRLDAQRQVLLDRLFWDEEGWPYVEKQQPSSGAFRPVFNK
ncbi:MAG: family 43 glycosylhydrolase [Tannerellaceae bacterium]|nr:family 43 glycosylhydrolase [Tannerellaceae bacterium]